MPFRDAGYSQADFSIGVQDVVYGVWKAKEEGLVGFRDFKLDEWAIMAYFDRQMLMTLQVREIREGRPRRFQLAHTQLHRACIAAATANSSYTT